MFPYLVPLVKKIGRDRILDIVLPTSREKSTVLFHRYSTYRTVIETENKYVVVRGEGKRKRKKNS